MLVECLSKQVTCRVQPLSMTMIDQARVLERLLDLLGDFSGYLGWVEFANQSMVCHLLCLVLDHTTQSRLEVLFIEGVC